MGATCPDDNINVVDQSKFWEANGVHWDAHRIGWAVAGTAASITVIISLISVLRHCRNYRKPLEQRQIIRILYMPPVYAVVSFFSYRFFRSYTYYSLAETAYEAVTISAFLLLLVEYVASTASGHSAENALMRKDKKALPFPFGHWRYRPTKAYFMYTLKWSVLQYVIIGPLLAIAGIVCQVYKVLCESESYNYRWAAVYLDAIDFVSISFALYGLIIFYGLTREELTGRRPLAKFLAIKMIVMFTFYQSFVFSMLQGRVIKPTDYWTETNIADGLNALAICLEMVIFSAFMLWAYSPNEYNIPGSKPTSILRPLWDSINPTDFAVEIYTSFSFFWAYAHHKPNTRGLRTSPLDEKLERAGGVGRRATLGEAFGVEGHRAPPVPAARGAKGFGGSSAAGVGRRSDDEGIRLAPYPDARADSSRPSRSSDASAPGAAMGQRAR